MYSSTLYTHYAIYPYGHPFAIKESKWSDRNKVSIFTFSS